jgi:hypothetical protein
MNPTIDKNDSTSLEVVFPPLYKTIAVLPADVDAWI